MTKATILIALAAALSAAHAGAQEAAPGGYLDDRSDPRAVILSLYNAINRHEYARAWSYWDDGPERPDYEAFRDGYADTEFVDVVTGDSFAEGAAGSIYFTVPVAVEAHEADGQVKVFAGCYWLRLGQPAIQEPPFRPMHILRGTLIPTDAPLDEAVPTTCPE